MELKGLKELIGTKKLKQYEIATKSGICPEQLSRYLNGRIDPSFRTLEKIAKLLKVKVEKLL